MSYGTVPSGKSSTSWRALLLLGFLLLAGGFIGTVQAGSGGIVGLPRPRVKNRSGLLLEIDTRWVDGNGYRPVRVRIFPAMGGTAPADRRIRVTITPRSPYNSTRKTAVTANIEISQGSAVGEASVPIPCAETWHTIDVATSEGGRYLSELSARNVSMGNRYYYEWSEAAPSVLMIDSDAPSLSQATRTIPKQDVRRLPDFRTLASLLPLQYWNSSITANTFDASDEVSDPVLMRLIADLPRLEALPPDSIPTSWIELTSVDIIFISFDELEKLVRTDRERFSAIRSWLATGPALVVYGVGDNFERLEDLESLLEVPPVDEAGAERGWSLPDVTTYGVAAFSDNTYRRNVRIQATTPKANKKTSQTPPVELPFVVRPIERGRVAAMAADDPFPGDKDLWNWLLVSLDDKQWMWYRRYGLSLQRENQEYWNLLIPGVGQAPVNSFLVLISLFVIVIGPINYFYLQRRGRLYLLLVTVPAGAALVTGGLLLYALLTDGLGVRSRIRSISEIDQRSGRAVSWSRQTYYAGLSPSTGLVYPKDVAAFPIDFRPHRMRSRGRRTEWGRQQRLSGGSFPSRSTVQLLVLESRPAEESIEFGEPVSNDSLPITNRLGVEILQMVARNADGDFFAGESIGVGQARALEKISQSDAARKWNALIAQHRPRYPDKFDPSQIENAADIFGMSYRPGDRSLSTASFSSSVFERALRNASVQNLSGLATQSYLAIVLQGPSVSVGVETEEQAGFHVVLGKW